MALIVEANHDERGIVWPKSVAPFEAHLVDIAKDKRQGEKIYEELKKAKVDVLYDDREDVSAGVKFTDADLIGIPVRLVVSDKTGDKIEWKARDLEKTDLISLNEVIKRLTK